ncbi:MAG: GDP-mannose 4,6-dehydratase [Bdellovibrionota bacterium]
MRALVIGGYGFVGRHLAQHLVTCGDDVAVTYLPDKSSGVTGPTPRESENRVAIPNAAQSLALDVTDRTAVFEVIKLLKPDAVYHLSGISHVTEAEKAGEMLFSVNMFGAMNVLDAIAAHSRESRFLFVSSAEVYGEPKPGGLPLTELSELRPISAYGCAKAAADLAVYKYFYREGIHTVRVRPFPHIGPGQSDTFAISGFAKQVAAIKLGKSKPIVKVGNLEAKRDYTDVLDIVRGYREALLNAKPGDVYNLCSGESLGIGDVLQLLIKLAGVDAEIVEDPARVRPVDISDLFGSAQKAQRDFGWKPRVEREASLDSLLAYWLEAL